MNAYTLIMSLVEGSKPNKSGIFVDFSAGREKPIYTCKCPNNKCGVIHGSFKSKAEAIKNRECKRCKIKSVDKIKRDIENVDKPKKPKKDNIEVMAKKIIESEDDDMSTKDFMRQQGMAMKSDQLTKEVCQNLRYGQNLYHRTKGIRVRVSGKCQTWKTRPNEFKLPVKYGLYESGYITNDNASEWSTEPMIK